jgi:predicted phage baseplate assembly protein
LFKVPKGTGFTRDPTGEVVFTLEQDVTVLPVLSLTLQAGGQDCTADLLAGRVVDLLPAGGVQGEARISLNLATPVSDGCVSLLFDLADPQTPTGTAMDPVPPAWSPDAVAGVPPPAALTWSYADDDAGTDPVPLDPVHDGTQGLRRSGIVQLPVPPSWNSGAGVRTLLLGTDQATFAAPPRLQQLQVNVAAARHWQQIDPDAEVLKRLNRQVSQWLPLPGLHLDLPPDTQGHLLDASLTLHERDGREHEWITVPDLAFSNREDRVFVTDRAAGALRFGDGRTGRIPVPDPCQQHTSISSVSWRLGGGAVGNGGTTSYWRTTDTGSVTAENLVPADGGVDAETIAQARIRAGRALNEVHRAVTPGDHETIAIQAPGLAVAVAVARAHAAVGDHPGYPCTLVPGAVSVYVVPAAPRGGADWDLPDFVAAPQPDPGMLSQVCTVLGQARLLGEELFVRKPCYRRARLEVKITGTPSDAATVRVKVQRALRQYLDPLVGGDDGSGWPFGAPLRPSALLQAAQGAAGHDGEVSSVGVALDATTNWETCRDVAIGPHELIAVEVSDVQVQFATASSVASAGGLP